MWACTVAQAVVNAAATRHTVQCERIIRTHMRTLKKRETQKNSTAGRPSANEHERNAPEMEKKRNAWDDIDHDSEPRDHTCTLASVRESLRQSDCRLLFSKPAGLGRLSARDRGK